MNLFNYPFHREFTVSNFLQDECLIFDCFSCPYSAAEFCCDYCIFSDSCITSLEMGWF